MHTYTIALFGEAEKGEYHRPCLCRSIPQLLDLFGNPPSQSKGIFFAIQALLYEHALLFFRVREEGFSYDDYLQGFCLLQNQTALSEINALYLPGVGNNKILTAIAPVCALYHSLLITNEADFYDYLTEC